MRDIDNPKSTKKTRNMRNILNITLTISFIVLVASCTNQDNSDDFEDFTEQNVYFPLQFPVRTISLIEDSRIDNSIDLERAFSIGVAIGGLRTNEIDRVINIAPAPDLVDGALINEREMKLMPDNYYSISSSSQITIPAGSFNGTLRVDLTDAFFQDTLALDANYVIPLRIANGNYDVLRGVPSVDNPDPRVIEDYEAGFSPKDFTLFSVKYINKYDGVYLHKGIDNTLDGPGGNVISSVEYNERFTEDNFLTNMVTKGLDRSQSDRMGQNTGDGFFMQLNISSDGSITIESVEGSAPVTGTGRFVDRDDTDAESWGEETRKTMFIEYEYQNNGEFHQAIDTLIFRNDDTVFEEFSITLEEDE